MARKKKDNIHGNLRRRVFERDNYTCRYCGSTIGPFHCDHVYPESKGGMTVIDNLATACQVCNQKKHAKIGIWPAPSDILRELENERQIAKRNSLITLDIRLLFNAFSVLCFACLAYALGTGQAFVLPIAAAGMWMGITGSASMLLYDKLCKRSAKRITDGKIAAQNGRQVARAGGRSVW